ncbi:MAG: hypothetical protein WA843_03210 [Candidatus Saccharimonadales bacterium]
MSQSKEIDQKTTGLLLDTNKSKEHRVAQLSATFFIAAGSLVTSATVLLLDKHPVFGAEMFAGAAGAYFLGVLTLLSWGNSREEKGRLEAIVSAIQQNTELTPEQQSSDNHRSKPLLWSQGYHQTQK